jgi:hypothetical protein
MAAKDANDTRRGIRAVTELQAKRLEQRKAGEKPKCGSPLVGSKIEGHKNYGKTAGCQRPAGSGTDHPGYGNCSWHAGNMPSSKVGAARERAHETVEKMRTDMAFYGVRIEISFEEALMEELQRSVGIVRWIETKLGQWGEWDRDGNDIWDASETGMPPLQREVHGFRNTIVADTEYAAWLRQYQLERRHLHAVAADGIKAGIAKQIVVLHQQQADAMNQIIRETLNRLGVDPGDDRLPSILPAVIREVTAARRAG